MFQGSIVALITPFRDGKVDEKAFQSLVERQIEQGTNGLVPCGTTGESPTLTHDEHKRVVELCLEVAKGRVPVIAGAGSNSTAEAVELYKHAQGAGADAALVVTPYYNKPNQAGLKLHYQAIAEAGDLPIIIYNIPPRSVIDMNVETMAELSKLPNIVGVKDATGDLTRPMKERMACGDDFCLLSGEDGTAVNYLAGGGSGCISVSANVAPKLCSDVQRLWREGKTSEAIELQQKLMPLHINLFCEPNPGPAKYAAELLGLCSAETRLPLAPLSDASKAKVKDALDQVGLL